MEPVLSSPSVTQDYKVFSRNNSFIPTDSVAVLSDKIAKLETKTTTEEFLSDIHVIIAVDTSASMKKPVNDKPNAPSRIQVVKDKIEEFVSETFKYNKGDIHFLTFATKVTLHEPIQVAKDVEDRFKNISIKGKTNIYDLLTVCFEIHKEFDPKLNKGTRILIITDGRPTRKSNSEDSEKTVSDKNRVRSKIVEISKEVLKHDDIGFSFLQVGNDSKATEFLRELDDDLVDPETKERVKDIVDTKSFEEFETLTIEKILYDSLYD
jgi:hypothetical protein